MTFELYKLVSSATGGAEPDYDDWVVALAQIAMVWLGSIYRFIANEGRKTEEGERGGACQATIATVSFTLSFMLFLAITWSIVEPIFMQKCPPGDPRSECEITDKLRKRDELAVYVFTGVWLGYPLVSLLSACFSSIGGYNQGFQLSQRTSFFKDISYGLLDIVSKAGLAFYAAYRSTWL